MKNITNKVLLLLIAGLFFTSCNKTVIEPASEPSFLSSVQNRQVFADGMKAFVLEKAVIPLNATSSANGVKFLVPWFTNSNWGIANFDFNTFSLELAAFSADLSGSDFFRENIDGTVSVHINSNTALAEYYANLFDPAALVLTGSPAHFSANYTGPVVEMDVPFPPFVIKMIDLNNGLPRALSVKGNGKVQENNEGPYQNLELKILETPSGQRKSEFTLK